MELLFECSTRYPPLPLFSLVSYRVDHSKRNSISTRTHVQFSLDSRKFTLIAHIARHH